ncbi:unnamed protein product, partial [Dovyalis caffra]
KFRRRKNLIAEIKFFPITLSIGLEAGELAESLSARAKNVTPALLGESFKGIGYPGGLMSGFSEPEAE